MKRKVSYVVNTTEFTVELEEDFAQFLEKQLEDDFQTRKSTDTKGLLSAYVKKCYSLYEYEKGVDKMFEQLNSQKD